MRTSDALRYYENKKMRLAKALGISRQAIQGWGEIVPLDRALTLQDLTHGKLKVKLELYRRSNGL